MRLGLSTILVTLVLMVSGCSLLPHKPAEDQTDKQNQGEKGQKPPPSVERAVSHTLVVVGICGVLLCVAAVVVFFLGVTPSSKTTAIQMLCLGALAVGGALVFEQWLWLLKYVTIGLIVSFVGFEIVTHYTMLRKLVKSGLSPIGQPN